MRCKCWRWLAFFLTLNVVAGGYAQETAKSTLDFTKILRKWERQVEVGNFLTGNARLNYPELIQSHPRYTEESRANMLKLIKNQTIFFLWLKNTGTEDISCSFGRMVLDVNNKEQYLPTSYYSLDATPIERDFIIAPGQEIGVAVHYPLLADPLGKVVFTINQCKYAFVTFAIEFAWDFTTVQAQAPENPLPQKKARLETLRNEMNHLQEQIRQKDAEAIALEKEIRELEKPKP